MGVSQSQYVLENGHRLLWYRIDRVLSHGTFGVTYLAEDINLQRPVAIKEFFPTQYCTREPNSANVTSLFADAEAHFKWALERFLSEARTLAQFEHPNIVRVINVFEENGTAYMVMHYERGASFSELLEIKRTLNEDELTSISKPLMDGLEKVHANGFVHRDIKPSNIYIRDDGTPVLLDFGSARQSIKEHTQDLNKLLSPGYAPIEQYTSNSGSQGPWSDIYSLGATLYRAVIGQAPPSAIERSEALMSGRKDILPTAELVLGTYSQHLLKAIDHALAFRSQDRPQDIASWRREFNYKTDTADDTVNKTDTSARPEKNADEKVAEVPPVGDLEDWLVDASSPGRYRQALMEAHARHSKTTTRTSTDEPDFPRMSPWESLTESVWYATNENRRRRGIFGYLKMGGGLPVIAIGALAIVLLFLMTTDPSQQTAQNGASQADAEVAARSDDNTDTEGTPGTNDTEGVADSNRDDQPESIRRYKEALDQTEQIALSTPPAIRSEPGSESALSANNSDAESVTTTGSGTEQQQSRPSDTQPGQQQPDIDTTLAAARADIAARRLTTPEGNNAYEKYLSVLEEDPENEAVREGFREIVSLYLQIANNAVAKGNFSHADIMLKRAEQVDPQSTRLLEAQDKLEAQREAARSDSQSSAAQRDDESSSTSTTITPVRNEESGESTEPSPPLPPSDEGSGAPVEEPSPPLVPSSNEADRTRTVSSPLPSEDELSRDRPAPSPPLTLD